MASFGCFYVFAYSLFGFFAKFLLVIGDIIIEKFFVIIYNTLWSSYEKTEIL